LKNSWNLSLSFPGILLAAVGTLGFAVLLHRFVPLFRTFALSLDLSFAASPLELCWGLLSAPVVEGSLAVGIGPTLVGETLLMVLLAGGAWGLVLLLQSPLSALVVWTLFLGCLGMGGTLLGMETILGGPHALAFAMVFIIHGMARFILVGDQPPPPLRAAAFSILCGIVAAWGSLYLFALAPLSGLAKQGCVPKRSGRFFLGSFLLVTASWLVVQQRFPHPSSTSPDGVFRQWGWIWLFGSDYGAPGGSTWAYFLHSFPGFGLILLAGLTALAAGVCGSFWRVAAGRIVPLQAGLYVAMGGVILIPWALWIEACLSLPPRVESLVDTRAVLRMSPPNTVLSGDESYLAEAVYLMSAEGIRPDLVARAGEAEGSVEESELPVFSHSPRGHTDGATWVRIEGEPLSFSPWYLLNATTEVYSATPAFFIGQATDLPRLRYRGRPLPRMESSEEGILDWGYSGEQFFLYRDHTQDPWKDLKGSIEADYFGNIPVARKQLWGTPHTPARIPERHDFYLQRPPP
jgi:hypothetical protein